MADKIELRLVYHINFLIPLSWSYYRRWWKLYRHIFNWWWPCCQSQHQLSSNVIRYIFIRGLWGGQIKMDFWLRVGQGRRMMKLTGTEFETHLSGSICLVVQKGQKLQQRMCLWSINYYYCSRRLPLNNNTTSSQYLDESESAVRDRLTWRIVGKSNRSCMDWMICVIHIKEGISVYLSHIWRVWVD